MMYWNMMIKIFNKLKERRVMKHSQPSQPVRASTSSRDYKQMQRDIEALPRLQQIMIGGGLVVALLGDLTSPLLTLIGVVSAFLGVCFAVFHHVNATETMATVIKALAAVVGFVATFEFYAAFGGGNGVVYGVVTALVSIAVWKYASGAKSRTQDNASAVDKQKRAAVAYDEHQLAQQFESPARHVFNVPQNQLQGPDSIITSVAVLERSSDGMTALTGIIRLNRAGFVMPDVPRTVAAFAEFGLVASPDPLNMSITIARATPEEAPPELPGDLIG